jgi:hypothetical protein
LALTIILIQRYEEERAWKCPLYLVKTAEIKMVRPVAAEKQPFISFLSIVRDLHQENN